MEEDKIDTGKSLHEKDSNRIDKEGLEAKMGESESIKKKGLDQFLERQEVLMAETSEVDSTHDVKVISDDVSEHCKKGLAYTGDGQGKDKIWRVKCSRESKAQIYDIFEVV